MCTLPAMPGSLPGLCRRAECGCQWLRSFGRSDTHLAGFVRLLRDVRASLPARTTPDGYPHAHQPGYELGRLTTSCWERKDHASESANRSNPYSSHPAPGFCPTAPAGGALAPVGLWTV